MGAALVAEAALVTEVVEEEAEEGEEVLVVAGEAREETSQGRM